MYLSECFLLHDIDYSSLTEKRMFIFFFFIRNKIFSLSATEKFVRKNESDTMNQSEIFQSTDADRHRQLDLMWILPSAKNRS